MDDAAADALRRARDYEGLPRLLREEPSREPPLRRAMSLAVSGVGLLIAGLIALAVAPDVGGHHLPSRGRGSFFLAGSAGVIAGAGMILVGIARWVRIRNLAPGTPRLARVERVSSRTLVGGMFALRRAELLYEGGRSEPVRLTTNAWMLMTTGDVGVAWMVGNLVVAYRTIPRG